LKRDAKEKEFIIHIHGDRSLITYNILQLLGKRGYKVYMQHHGSKGSSVFTPIERRLFKHARKIFVISKNKASYVKRMGLVNVKVQTMGVDYNIFKPLNKKYARRAIGLEEGRLVILYVGRLSPEKNLKTLLFAYKELQEKIRKTKLIIIGRGPDFFYLKKLSERLSLRNLIWIDGVSHDLIASYYKSADVFVLPSKKEVQCISVLEAMASGLPVVTPYYSGIRGTIFDEETGLFFKNNDYHNLVEKLMRLNHDENLRKKIGKKAQNHIKNNFDWNILIPKYIEPFHEVMANE